MWRPGGNGLTFQLLGGNTCSLTLQLLGGKCNDPTSQLNITRWVGFLWSK